MDLPTSLSVGIYIVRLNTEDNINKTKKIVIN
ncbi:T9SS type A sorting domain-containing protein [Tenacibaculum holothuriorum]